MLYLFLISFRDQILSTPSLLLPQQSESSTSNINAALRLTAPEHQQRFHWSKDTVKTKRFCAVKYSWKTCQPFTLVEVDEKEDDLFKGIIFTFNEESDTYSRSKLQCVMPYSAIITSNFRLTQVNKLTIEVNKTIQLYFE